MRKKEKHIQKGRPSRAMAQAKTHNIRIEVIITQEDDCYLAYCPALELSSYGDSLTDAKKAFGEALAIFIGETERKGTLEKVLLGLGWTLQQKPSYKYQPPEKNPRLGSRAIQTFKETVSIPM